MAEMSIHHQEALREGWFLLLPLQPDGCFPESARAALHQAMRLLHWAKRDKARRQPISSRLPATARLLQLHFQPEQAALQTDFLRQQVPQLLPDLRLRQVVFR